MRKLKIRILNNRDEEKEIEMEGMEINILDFSEIR